MLELLSKDEIRHVDQTSRDILSGIGINLTDGPVAKKLLEAGAVWDELGKRILLSGDVVDSALKSLPKEIRLFARNEDFDCPLSGRNFPALTTDGTCYQVLDHDADTPRKSTTKDLFQCATVAENLDEVDIFWPMVIAGDVPEQEHTAKELAISMLATSKHIQHEASDALCARAQIGMAAAAVGGPDELRKRPIFSSVFSPVSPLTFELSATEALMELCPSGIPIVGMSLSSAGASTPIGLAATLAVANAEILATLTLVQAIERGTAFMYCMSSAPIDFQQYSFQSGAPELALLSACGAQMARHYGLPSIVAGMVTDSRYPSQQTGFEKMESALLAALSRTNVVSGIGCISSDNLASMEQMVIDADMWGSIKRVLQGISISKNDVSENDLKLIRESTKFQNEIETAKRYSKEIWQPRIPYRRSYSAWKASGGRTIEELARESVAAMISEGGKARMEKSAEKEILTIYRDYQRKLYGKE